MENKINSEEARAALRELETIDKKSHYMAFADYASLPMMLWGVIWVILYSLGFLFAEFGFRLFGLHPDRLAVWISGVGVVVTLSYSFLKIGFANPIRTRGAKFESWRAPLFFFVWLAFSYMMGRLIKFESGWAQNVYHTLFSMFLFFVYGFWFGFGLFIVMGSVISISSYAGYLLLPDQKYYAILMAVVGGGSMFFGGLYALLITRTKSGDDSE